MNYQEFLESKIVAAPERGLGIGDLSINPLLKPHQRAIVEWALRKGCAAIFAAFGLGKTFMQLEIARLISEQTGEPFLIIAPLGVRVEFMRDAEKLGINLKFIQSTADYQGQGSIYLTNYESVREGKLDPRSFVGCSLDEAAILRGFGGTKTFREFMRIFENGQVKYKFVATATPSPNEYIELLAYAAFLDVMDVSQAKTRFFKRDSTKADNLTLHSHKEREFWLWVSSWAIFLQKPSDLGYDDTGYELPEMEIHWHEIATNHLDAGMETSGQHRLVRSTAIGVTHAAKEKRDSLPGRIEKLMELRQLDPEAHRVIWHDLESERHAIEQAIPDCGTVYGSQKLEDREEIIIKFSEGELQEVGGKPSMLGAGVNFQRHCSWSIFLGIGFKFHEFIQAVHRVHRFLQTKTVRLDLIYTEAEREVRRILEEKWAKHNELVAQMSAIIRQYGLATNALEREMTRTLGVERQEVSGENYKLVLNDSVMETSSMPENSVHLILSSIPFSTQYEYTPSYNDFGHTETNEQFWEQMGYLIPELYRILHPGRCCLIHVKDRIVPGGLNGLGFQTAYPFHCDAIRYFCRDGFAYLGMVTIVTDVVRENSQTYRLGWTEQCKDGTKMGVGMPEYLLLFRKPPTDSSNGYADLPVIKNKAEYTRSRWQIDAHAFHRSSGNRLLCPEDLVGVPHERIFKMFRKFSREEVYNFEHHVKLSESLETCQECNHVHIGSEACKQQGCTCRGQGRLPVTFMLFQPQSWSDEIWTDITRMRTLNLEQYNKGQEFHLCPMQFDLADRAITRYTMPGETVYDPFSGIGTVPLRAVLLNRKGMGCELSPTYFRDAAYYLDEAERKLSIPTLFDLHEEVIQESA